MTRVGLFLILTPFALIGSVMAFLITYEEMQHHYRGWLQPLLQSLPLSIVALAVWLALSWIIAAALYQGVR